MKIYTGNFANVKKYREKGFEPINIALSARYFTGQQYIKLRPKWEFKDDVQETYEPKFNEILKNLKPDDVINDLTKLSGGKDIVLCCHEKEGDFCHRRIVAEWLEKTKNIEVKELGKMQPIQKELF
jgi:uncharacterized protein (DUF488 family)